MVDEGDPAPEFTAFRAEQFPPDQFSVSAAYRDSPIVLAFFPLAFTGGCTEELCAFRDEFAALETIEADVYGISVDSPATLLEFEARYELGFELVSDFNRDAIEAYDVVCEELAGLRRLAQRSVFVVDTDGTVVYTWRADEPGQLPDIEAVKREVDALSPP